MMCLFDQSLEQDRLILNAVGDAKSDNEHNNGDGIIQLSTISNDGLNVIKPT